MHISQKHGLVRWTTATIASVALLLAGLLSFSVPAFALPEGRVYEQVSPVYKGGYAAVLDASSLNGESVAFRTYGVLRGLPYPAEGADGSLYLARRGPTGWSTTPAGSPFSIDSSDNFSTTLEDVLGDSPIMAEMSFFLYPTDTPDVLADWQPFGNIVMDVPPVAGDELAYESPVLDAADQNLCHVVLTGGQLLPEAQRGKYQLYDLSRGCGGEAPSLRLVGVKNKLGASGEPESILATGCEATLGVSDRYTNNTGDPGEPSSDFNAVAAGGGELFFTSNVEESSGGECRLKSNQLFVRLGGSRTVEVSRPLVSGEAFGGCGGGGSPGEVPGEVPCAGASLRASAYFKGASEDGSRVFFMTSAPLVGGGDGGSDLYMASIGCPAGQPGCEPSAREVTGLVDVSHDQVAGQAAEVQGVVSIGQDGERVYFVAHGVLGEGAGPEGQTPVAGAENLYVYDALTGKTAFVADLCSGPALSGDLEDIRCPRDLTQGAGSRNDADLWGETSEAQSTANGEFLAFSSYGQLVASDTDTAKDVYRYDALTGTLDRVSLGEAGYDANGNDSAFDATIPVISPHSSGNTSKQYDLGNRAISEDGSRIVFSTIGPLSADAINGKPDIYEWHKEPGWAEGRVSLVSSGTSSTNDFGVMISPDGSNIFFMTSQALVAQDTDSFVDVYDARLEGGFPPPPAARLQCSSDACQGPLTNPVPLLVPGSVSQAPGGNFPVLAAPRTAKPRKAKPKKAKPKKVKPRERVGKSRSRVSSRKETGRVLRVSRMSARSLGRSGR